MDGLKIDLLKHSPNEHPADETKRTNKNTSDQDNKILQKKST